MAKIHKMTIYFVDPNDQYDANEIETIIENDDYLPSAKVVKAETKEFEWDDDLAINKLSASTEDFDEFFDNIDNPINLKVGMYVEGFEDTLPQPRWTRGWITSISDSLITVQADDGWGGARGTSFDRSTVKVLHIQKQPPKEW